MTSSQVQPNAFLRRATLLASLSTLALLVPLAGARAQTNAPAPYKIGVVLSLSGPAAVFGIPERDAIATVAASINKAGGVNGHQLALTYFDDTTNPTEATRGVTELIQSDGVVTIIGPGTGSGILASGPIAERLQTPLIAPAGTVSLTDKKNSFYPWIFRAAPDDITGIKVILSDAAKNGAKKLAVVYQEDAYGKNGLAYAETLAKTLGIEIVAEVSAPLNSTDLGVQATKVRDAKPDAVFMQASISALGASFVKSAREVGLTVPIYANDGLAQKSFLDAMGKEGDGIRVLSIGNLPYDPVGGEKKLSAMLIAAGHQPQGWGELVGTNALMLVVAALKTIKGEPTGVSMRAALETACGFETYARGRPCYSADSHDGIGADALVITEVRDGKLVSRK